MSTKFSIERQWFYIGTNLPATEKTEEIVETDSGGRFDGCETAEDLRRMIVASRPDGSKWTDPLHTVELRVEILTLN